MLHSDYKHRAMTKSRVSRGFSEDFPIHANPLSDIGRNLASGDSPLALDPDQQPAAERHTKSREPGLAPPIGP